MNSIARTVQMLTQTNLQKALRTLLSLLILVGSQSHAEEAIIYYHVNHLGSPVAVTDENGDRCWKEEYEPYGRKVHDEAASCGLKFNERGFTSHLYDRDLDLTYMQGRYFDQNIGRFYSVDPAEINLGNPRSLNRYAYANNNPYAYKDPDGNNAVTAFGGVLYETGQFLQGNGFNGGLLVGALVDGYDGNGAGFADAALQDVLSFGAGAFSAGVKLYTLSKGAFAARTASVSSAGRSVEKGGLNLFKWGDSTSTKAVGWKEGDYFLHLPNKGGSKANWKQNSSRLREEMGSRKPIYDSYRNS